MHFQFNSQIISFSLFGCFFFPPFWLWVGVRPSSINLHYINCYKHWKVPGNQSESQEPGSSFTGRTEVFKPLSSKSAHRLWSVYKRIKRIVPSRWCALSEYLDNLPTPPTSFKPHYCKQTQPLYQIWGSPIPQYVPTVHAMKAFLENAQLKFQSKLNA